jgi:hypothetical protein
MLQYARDAALLIDCCHLRRIVALIVRDNFVTVSHREKSEQLRSPIDAVRSLDKHDCVEVSGGHNRSRRVGHPGKYPPPPRIGSWVDQGARSDVVKKRNC